MGSNYYLNQSAKDAYRSYILAYNSHSMKDIFDVHRLDLQVKAFLLGILAVIQCQHIGICIFDNNFKGDRNVLEI